MASSAIAPASDWVNTSAASRWASRLRWRGATAFAPDALGRLHGLCLVHLQGPWTKALFMSALTTPTRARARQNRTEPKSARREAQGAYLIGRHKTARQDQARFGPGGGVPRHGIPRQQAAAAAAAAAGYTYAGDEARRKRAEPSTFGKRGAPGHRRGEGAPVERS